MAITKNQRLELLKDVSAAHLQLLKTISSLRDAELTRPNTVGIWSGKDVISHLGDWIGVYNSVIQNRQAGRPDGWPTGEATGVSLQEWNEGQVIAHADWSVDEVKEYLQSNYDALMDTLEQTLDVDPVEVLDFTRDHYSAHLDDLTRSRNQ